MIPEYDVIIIGGGILGVAHAYHCLKLGKKVALLEKDVAPNGSTVRNFGQIVPSGMNSLWQKYGRRSLDIYKEIQTEFNISVTQNGSTYLASDAEEMNLLEELHALNKYNEYPSYLLNRSECYSLLKSVNREYVFGGLHFPQEINVDPRIAIHRMIDYLVKKFGLKYFPNTPVMHVEKNNGAVEVTNSYGDVFKAEICFLTCGSDFEFLFPEIFNASDLIWVKLQMLELVPQKTIMIPGSILTGWTIRRYESFQECPSYDKIKAKEDANSYQNLNGIHMLFKQNPDGSIIVGDSHEYFKVSDGVKPDFYMNYELNEFMIEEGKRIFNLESWSIQKSWIGIYSQCENSDMFHYSFNDQIHIVSGIGGKGMTASLGYAEEHVNEIFSKKPSLVE